MDNDQLKKEAREEFDKLIMSLGYRDIFSELEKVKVWIEEYIDKATLAERKRITDKINNLKVMDDNGVWSFVKQQLLKSIERL